MFDQRTDYSKKKKKTGMYNLIIRCVTSGRNIYFFELKSSDLNFKTILYYLKII